jgi:hypothetical protein
VKLCENCGLAPPAFPGASGAGGQFCGTCIDEKAHLILDVHEVIRNYSPDVEET